MGDHHPFIALMVMNEHDRMQILNVIEKMRRNLQYDHPLEDLAGYSGMSVRRFTASFRMVTGFAVQQYLIYMRMTNAAELLTNTNLPITTIAKKTGYSNKSAFSRKFKSIIGMKPMDYRRLNKG
ncbi:AraC family transcriptional regulator [Chitinophaga pollutisoli]|uniref:AraC family transcriptional regulator n=1 Tax=Chitinophaga pollutisoli TaxID=3133966 RepID=A0ABZ2YRZ1_9BACT